MTAVFAVGSVIAGKYRLDRLLGEGGMGAVYLAENLDIGRPVAIKVLRAQLGRDEAVMSRFRQEARSAAAVDHPGIVQVLDMGQAESGEPFIVMERLDGETLGARIRQRGRLSADETLTIMIEVLDALAAAHAKGIVHRDLKPDNLFLVWRPRWAVKVLDFGISRLANPDEVRITETNQTMGSVLYMPPEQARDARSAGPPADLYAIGATMFHALAGRPPFLGENYTEVLAAVLSDPAPPLASLAPTVPAPLAALVDRMLAKAPGDRPQSAAAVRDELRALGGGSVPARSPSRVDELGATAAPVASDALAATAASEPPRRADIALGATAAPEKLGVTAATEAPATSPPIARAPSARRRGPALLATVVAALALIGGGIAIVMRGSSRAAAPPDAPPVASPAAFDAASVTIAHDALPATTDAAVASADASGADASAAPADAARRHVPPPPVLDAQMPDAAGKPDARLAPDAPGVEHVQFAPTEGNQ
ncbi:MAG: protein kinase [Deltaproteobacteria bacterium]|nr:protein kinase [Deltaproteobacteria bacterium]